VRFGSLATLVAGSVLVVVLLAIASGEAPRHAAAVTPEEALLTYLRALYARDHREAYRWISSDDRAVKTAEQYTGENLMFSGVRLQMARALADFIRLEDARKTVEGDRVTLSVKLVLPDANAREIDDLVLGFEDERLSQLAPSERARILEKLERMGTSGQLPVIVGEDEQWELVHETAGWRVALNWENAVTVRFEGAAEAGLPWDVTPVQPVMRAKPGETLQTQYRVRNRSDRAITGKARHLLEPPEDTGHLQIVSCFCFLQQTLDPGQERLLPVIFRVNYEIPENVRDVRVRYEFYPIERFPWSRDG
jgi:hypothetical protein